MKNRKILLPAILASYAVPYVFLGMYGDYAFHKFWPYIVLVAVPAVLAGVCACRKWLGIACLGNLLSTAVSWLCVTAVATEKWNYFFKAFPCTIRLFQFAGIALVIQGILWWIVSFYRNNQEA